MESPYEPLLTTADWNDEWKQLQKARRHSDDPAVWDERAKTFPVKHGSQTGYVERFLKLADVQPGETVLDMGCGTGALATPLAQCGCRVVACDFSRGMLEKMREDQASLGVHGVDARLLSWADDWSSAGIGRGSVDVALASRSIATDDLHAALMRLDAVARRRVCITLPCGPSPRIDERLLAAAGFGRVLGRDFLYAFNILAACGINPEVSYIESERIEVFASREDALERYARMVEGALADQASADELSAVPARLSSWLDDNLVCDGEGWHLGEPRSVTWAFLAWTPASPA